MPTLLMTGFPGFLGSELLPRILKRHANDVIATCLVQGRFMELARRRVDDLTHADPALAGRVRLLEGDITRADLGLGAARELREQTIEIFHLAAIYDLAVGRELALRVNVDGTRNLLDFAAGCPRLGRLHHVSTCYVSGRYPGAFTERDLAKRQQFNNYYEETKYLAEVDVQRRMRGGLPATIYRPSIAVGDSTTGATQKYDGPYFIIQWLLRQRGIALMPLVGDPRRTRVNVVPRDFVIAAIAHLSGLDQSRGRVYQLCDPDAPTVDEMIDILGQAIGRRILRLPVPYRLARGALGHGPGVDRLLRIPAEALDYFVQPTYYTCENTLNDLEGSGIRCPGFSEYAGRLVGFMRAHPEIGASPMV